MRNLLTTALLLLVIAASAAAQVNPALAGSWVLTQEPAGRSARGGGIPGVPLATEMTIKVSPAEVTVDTNTGSAQAMQTAVYKLNGTETTVPGPLGWTVKAKAALKDAALVVTTVRSLEGPNGPVGAEIVDVYTVDSDVLTLVRTQGRNKQVLTYKRKPA